ncbi:hypothetical protein N7533_008122 [Penicillium manginii]|uniref:uncharacterized protein n=1 Tax=Penicillium manginii TaxID=203109 RepID=UPI0025492A6D|nr:uncharacterized protein N7533_008122 [Penicillium manginii]KAJ5751094.1 hypothetical protein N7533_008122 [Penicillium manginii]
MFDTHSKLGIAQIIFYIPVTVLAVYLAFYRHNRPRMAWLILMFFSIIRITGGILVILWGQIPQTGLMVAAIIFLNTGVFPLIAATLGLIRLIMAREDMESRINRHLVLSRMLFFIALGLTIAGGVLEGSDTLSDVETGVKLVKAGYSLVVVFVACLLAIQISLWTRYTWLATPSQTILNAATLATPFITVRICYLFLSVFYPLDPRWSNLTGHIVPFLFMGLIMEYCVVGLFLGTGFVIPRMRNGSDKRGLLVPDTPDRQGRDSSCGAELQ